MGLEICEERCNQCLFSENRIVSKARMAQRLRMVVFVPTPKEPT